MQISLYRDPRGAAARAPRPAHGWILRAALSILALAFLAHRVDAAKLAAALGSFSLGSILTAALIALAQVWAAAARWHGLNVAFGLSIARIDTLKLYLHSLLIGQLLPASLGSDAVRVWGIYHRGGQLAAAAGAIIIDRLAGSGCWRPSSR